MYCGPLLSWDHKEPHTCICTFYLWTWHETQWPWKSMVEVVKPEEGRSLDPWVTTWKKASRLYMVENMLSYYLNNYTSCFYFLVVTSITNTISLNHVPYQFHSGLFNSFSWNSSYHSLMAFRETLLLQVKSFLSTLSANCHRG